MKSKKTQGTGRNEQIRNLATQPADNPSIDAAFRMAESMRMGDPFTPLKADTKPNELIHFDSAAFSKFFQKSNGPNGVGVKSAAKEKGCKEEGIPSTITPPLPRNEDGLDDISKLNRIFSNDRIHATVSRTLFGNPVPEKTRKSFEGRADQLPFSLPKQPVNFNVGCGLFFPIGEYPQFLPHEKSPREDQSPPMPTVQGDGHNTSFTTVESMGHLERLDKQGVVHGNGSASSHLVRNEPYEPSELPVVPSGAELVSESRSQYPAHHFSSPMFGFIPPRPAELAPEAFGVMQYSQESCRFFDAPPMPRVPFGFGQGITYPQSGFSGEYGIYKNRKGSQGPDSTFYLEEDAKSNDGLARLRIHNTKKSGKDSPDNEDYEFGDVKENFEVDVKHIDRCPKTTLMIKNIPNKYNLPLILETIDKNHKGKYDFFYLPIDFRNNCNVGYAFINFIDTRFIKAFFLEFNGKKWEKFNSEKICLIKYARIQGRDSLISHFQYSSVMNQSDKKLRPVIFPKADQATIDKLSKPTSHVKESCTHG